MDNTVKSNQKEGSSSSLYNQIEFFTENLIKSTVNTALPVKVVGVEANGVDITGYVNVIPLVQSYDNFGNAIPANTIFKVPYCRIQGGKACLIIDPVIGDKGIAIFSQQDITNLGDNPQKPFTLRCFDMADALYIGGILNQAPSVYVELTQDDTIEIIAPNSVNIKTENCSVECSSCSIESETTEIKSTTCTLESEITDIKSTTCTVESPNLTVNSSALTLNSPMTTISGVLAVGAIAPASGVLTLSGSLTTTGDVGINGKSFSSHTHSGVESGNKTTSTPN